MAIFEWDSSIELGIPLIDEQHRALFGWVNSLDEAISSGEGPEAVSVLIWKLISYVTTHFSEEERLMLSGNYPGLPAHHKEHDRFVSRLREIQAGFDDGHEMSESVLSFLVEWLVCHIKGTDQAYCRFISTKQKS